MPKDIRNSLHIYYKENDKEIHKVLYPKTILGKKVNWRDFNYEMAYDLYNQGWTEVCKYFKVEIVDDLPCRVKWTWDTIPNPSIPNEKYDEIITFAELNDFQERPFKQLSSGMKSRLAFSIACLVNPDILILDEVLSVGDGAFREKSGNRMKEILNKGVTCLFVSHAIAQIRELCNKVLWLDHGNQIAFGETEDIINAYVHYMYQDKKKRHVPESMDEIMETSRRYKIYLYLAEQERKNNWSEWLSKEAMSARERRWMATVDAMSEEERENIFQEYLISKSMPAVNTDGDI